MTRKTVAKNRDASLFKLILIAAIGIALLLVAGIIILDKRAVEHGHAGLWESMTQNHPAASAAEVEARITERMKPFTADGTAVLIQEGQTRGRENETLKYKTYRLRSIDAWNSQIKQFEPSCERYGVVVYNRFTSQNPVLAEYTVFVGTRGLRTHKIMFKCDVPVSLPEDQPSPERPVEERANDTTPSVSLVFDDFGTDLAIAKRFLNELSVPITLAVIPNQEHSGAVIELAREHDQSVLLHVPMEPASETIEPGSYPVFLTMSMSVEAIDQALDQLIRTHPGVVGINNHMGSRLTADAERMRAVMRVLKRHHLFFIDSRTTASTVAIDMAREIGVACQSRSVFLDQGYKGGDVAANMVKLFETAEEKGYAIGIGHAIPSTLDAVRASLTSLRSSKVKVVPLPAWVNRG